MSADAPSGPFRIGPFEALERLGRGGFASVYRARDLRSGQYVALKVVPPGTDPESVRRLVREARAVARVSHPNVVQVYECGVTAEGAYVAMELLVGRTLQDLIDEVGALDVPRALAIALQVLDGLDVAHQHKIVHRDVKPGNIFLVRGPEGDEIPRILDFGVSKLGSSVGSSTASLHQDRTLPGTALGTPGFMAPEQYGSAHAADARADVYGVAATLYAMLTGRLPFDAGTYESWVMKVKGERAPSIAAQAPHVAPALAMAIDRALARDPDARWSTAREFARALGGQIPAPLGSTGRRDVSPAHASYSDATSPLMPRGSLGAGASGGVTGVVPSDAASTPRTERDVPPSTEPRPAAAMQMAAPAPAPARPPPAAAAGAGAPGGARPKKASLDKKKRSGASGGVWFVSGALVGALLAALGAGLALWARARSAPPPEPPPPAAAVDAAPPVLSP